MLYWQFLLWVLCGIGADWPSAITVESEGKSDVNKILLVTAASRGIGAAICRKAAEESYAVAVNYRTSRESAEVLVEELRSKGGRAVAIKADLSVEQDVMAMFAEIDRQLGPLTHLVNNGGGGKVFTGPDGCLIADTSFAMYRDMFDLNFGAAMMCTREALGRMVKHGTEAGCAVVNISSDRGRHGGFPRGVLYGAAKGALDNLTVGLAREVAPLGIRVNAVRPATIATDAHASSSPEGLDAMRRTIPLGRIGAPQEVADVVLFLLSPKASFMTGALVDVTGGR